MAGLVPDPGAIAHILDLVRSPRVQYSVNQFKNILPQAAGPLQAPSSRLGAAPKQHGGSGGVSGLGNALGASLGGLFGDPQQQQQSDPTTDLYMQLLQQLQSPVGQPQAPDSNAIMNQVRNAVNPIFDAKEQSARDQTGRATAQTKDMYRALSNDYERLAPQQIAQAQAAQKEIEGLYGQLRSNIEGNYARVSSDQAELFKQLGIEDALPSVLDEQSMGVNDALTAASENQAQQQQRYLDQGQVDSTFYREGSPIATMAGNEASTALLNQLSDYLKQTEGERASGIQSGYLDQMNQANSRYDSQMGQANSETARRQQMLFEMLQAQMKSPQQQALTPDSFMGSLDPQDQQSVAGAFTRLQRSPAAIYGKVEDPRNPVPGTFVDTTPEYFMQQADEMLKSGQIDPQTHQELLQYIQLYYGLGKGRG